MTRFGIVPAPAGTNLATSGLSAPNAGAISFMRGYGGPPKRRFAHPADGIDDELRFLLYSLQRSADLQAEAVGQFAYAFDSAL